jgi:hypothetical protein
MNIRRPSEASMRIDLAAKRPVIDVLCHQLIGIAGLVRKPPLLERAAVSAGPLDWVANDWQLTPSQKTVGPRFFGHAEFPRFFEVAWSYRFGASVDFTHARNGGGSTACGVVVRRSFRHPPV